MGKGHKILNYRHSIKVLTLMFVLFFSKSWGQVVYFHDFGTTTISTNPYTVAPPTINPNLNSSQWTTSVGTFTNFNGSAGQALSLNNSSGTPSLTLTFNVAAGCALDITSFNFWRQRSSSGAQTWTLTINGIVVGNGTIPTSGAFIGNTAVASAVNGLTGAVSVVFSVSGASGSGTIRLDEFTLNGSTSCGATNTITTGLVSSSPFALTDCTITASGTVDFTSSGTFTGNTYTAQLSNASGGFSSPINIGTLVSNANSGTINITIPAGTPSGSGYLIRVVSSSPSVTGSNSSAFTITLTCVSGTVCPSLLAVVINGCDGSCNGEGNNEFLVLSSGSYSIPVTPANIQIIYSGGSPTLQNFTESFAPQPSVITNLNSLAGCGTLFVDVSSGTVPPNSTFFIMNQGSCFNSGSFSSYCGAGTIYVAFSTDASWAAGGYFGNNSTPRYFQTDFSGVNASCGVTTYSYNYSGSFGFPSDGAAVMFNGTTPSYVVGNGNCVPPNIILPIQLIDFYATKKDNHNEVTWKVTDEINIYSYLIEKSDDGVNFSLLENTTLDKGKVYGQSIKSYSVIDENPFNEITYYRLATKSNDGSIEYYKIISINEKSSDWNVNHYQLNENFVIEFKNSVPKNSTLSLFDLSGKLLVDETIKDSQTKINTQYFSDGIYFLRITTPYKTQNFKIVIQK